MFSKKIYLIVSLCIIGLYLFTLKGNFDQPFISQLYCPFESAHECAPFANMQSLIYYGSNSLDKNLVVFGRIDVGFYQGNFYSLFPPGLAILAIPFYLLGHAFHVGQLFAFSFVMICALLNGLLLYYISRSIFKLSTRASLITPVIFLLSSTAWSYGITFFQHQVSTTLLLLCFWLIWKGSQTSLPHWKYTYVPVALYGLSGHIDYPNLVLLSPMMVYLLVVICKAAAPRIQKAFLMFKLLAVLGILLLSYPLYNHILFGDWRILQNRLPHFFEVEEAGVAEQEKLVRRSAVSYIFVLDRLPKGLYTLLFSPGRGLFLYSPIFIFIFFTLRKRFFKNATTEQCILWLTVILFLLLYGSYGDASGGFSYGPRFLVPIMAILSLFVAQYIDSLKNKIITIALFITLSYSQAIALLGAITQSINVPCVAPATISTCTYVMNIGHLISNKSNSFVYKTMLQDHVPLFFVYIFILMLITSMSATLIFQNKKDPNST
ncbi:MAG: hypothetical protein V4519_04765 [Patescibacteria group bacterium]